MQFSISCSLLSRSRGLLLSFFCSARSVIACAAVSDSLGRFPVPLWSVFDFLSQMPLIRPSTEWLQAPSAGFCFPKLVEAGSCFAHLLSCFHRWPAFDSERSIDGDNWCCGFLSCRPALIGSGLMTMVLVGSLMPPR